MKQKVVVIGHGYTSRLGMIRSLGSAGFDVSVVVMAPKNRFSNSVNKQKPIDCYSKYVSKVYYNLSSDKDGLIRLLLTECVDPQQKVVIIPDSDGSAAAIDLHLDVIEKHFIVPHIGHRKGAVFEWMNKQKQKDLAISMGLNVAKSWIVSVVHGSYNLPGDIQYPCFPKPLATIEGGKSGLKKCDTPEQLHSVVDALSAKKDINILVENYIEIEKEYAVIGVANGDKVFIPGVVEIMSMAKGSHYGVAKQGIVKPVGPFEELVEKFKLLVQSIGFTGLFDIDFYESKGLFYFGELNLRYGGSGYAFSKIGVNLPAMFVNCLLGGDLEDCPPKITSEATYVNERMCVDDYIYGYISSSELKQLMDTADIHFIREDNDREPYRQFVKYEGVLRWKRLSQHIKSFIKK